MSTFKWFISFNFFFSNPLFFLNCVRIFSWYWHAASSYLYSRILPCSMCASTFNRVNKLGCALLSLRIRSELKLSHARFERLIHSSSYLLKCSWIFQSDGGYGFCPTQVFSTYFKNPSNSADEKQFLIQMNFSMTFSNGINAKHFNIAINLFVWFLKWPFLRPLLAAFSQSAFVKWN